MIIHLDIDSFFASVEESIRPELEGREVIVAHPEGMVLAANYLAKAKGVRTTDLAALSIKKLSKPSLLPVRYWAYSLASINFFEILEEVFKKYQVLIEQVSIDECFIKIEKPLDLTALKFIRDELYRQTKLPVSIGAGESKLIAKQASKSAKPFGVLLIKESEGLEFLMTFPLEKLWGFGPKTVEKLKNYGVESLEDLINLKVPTIANLDIDGFKEHLFDDKVNTSGRGKSISVERSIRPGHSTPSEINGIFEDQLNSIAYRIKKSELGFKNIELRLTISNGEQSIYRYKESNHTTNLNLLAYQFRTGYQELIELIPIKQLSKITLNINNLANANNMELFSDYPIYEITPPNYTLNDVAFFGLKINHKFYGKGNLISVSNDGFIIKFSDRERIIIDEGSLLYYVN